MKKTKKLISMILCLVLLASVAVIPADAAFEPAKPANVVARAYENYVFLMWDEVPLSSGYRVFLKVDGKWKKLADVDEGMYYAEDLKPSTSYTFAVRTYRKIGSKYTWSKEYTSVKVRTEGIGNIYYLDAFPKANSVKLEWEPVYAASGYRIYQYKGGKWVKIKDLTVKNTDDLDYVTYTVTGLEPEKAYTFAVRPFVNTEKGKTWSKNYTKVKVTTRNLYELSVQSTDKKAGTVTLGWDKVDGARGYRLYRRVDGKWKAVKTTAALSYTVSGIKNGRNEYFCVRAYKISDGKAVWYPLSKSCKVVIGKTPSTTAEMCEAYNNAVNNLRAYNGKVKVTEKSDLFCEVTDASSESIVPVLNDVLSSFNGENSTVQVFRNGESEDGYYLDRFVPPYGKKSQLTKSDVASASVKATADGYTITFVIKKDVSEYDGKTNKLAVHHAKVLDSMDISTLEVSPVAIKEARMVYPGATVKATVDSQGRLSKLAIDCDIDAEVTTKVTNMSLSVAMDISNDMTYTMVYY